MRPALIHAKRFLYSLPYALKIGSSVCFFVHWRNAPISRQHCSPGFDCFFYIAAGSFAALRIWDAGLGSRKMGQLAASARKTYLIVSLLLSTGTLYKNSTSCPENARKLPSLALGRYRISTSVIFA